ncbi:MAG: hypothetical protein L0G70_04585 [Rubrobacter sp.]|nr:hypothetical protein [Rubrobacter sp.]
MPPEKDRQQEAEDEGRTNNHHLEGSEDAGRALTVNFSALLQTLGSLEDPDPAAESLYEPGLALLNALIAEREDFGTAAPGVDPHAPLAEQILAITDEAFDKAHSVLEALSDEMGPAHAGGMQASQLYVLMYRLRTISITDERRRLDRLPPAPEPATGSEFY